MIDLTDWITELKVEKPELNDFITKFLTLIVNSYVHKALISKHENHYFSQLISFGFYFLHL